MNAVGATRMSVKPDLCSICVNSCLILELVWPLLLELLFEAAQADVLSARAAVVASKMARIIRSPVFRCIPLKINRRRKAQLHEFSISFASSTFPEPKIGPTSVEPLGRPPQAASLISLGAAQASDV
jgi:hypothetical protein